jgi:predicted transcriptional regulator
VTAVAALLQTPGVNVNVRNNFDGSTPIMLAAMLCNIEIVELLLQDQRVELSQGLEEQVEIWSGCSQQQKSAIVRLIQEERRKRERSVEERRRGREGKDVEGGRHEELETLRQQIKDVDKEKEQKKNVVRQQYIEKIEEVNENIEMTKEKKACL